MTAEPQVKSPKPRRSGVVIPHRPKWHGEIAACAMWLLGRTLSATWRISVADQTGLPQGDRGPLIVAMWHNRLALVPPLWNCWQKWYPGQKMSALISASRDGALLARTLGYLGISPIRGSSSRRGPQALLELSSALRDGSSVTITPDGPRGPKYKVQPGIISLGQISGVPIVPLGAHVAKKKELRSWDQFQVPLPFTRCEIVMGPAIRVPRDASPEAHEKACEGLEATMLRLNRD